VVLFALAGGLGDLYLVDLDGRATFVLNRGGNGGIDWVR